MAYKQIKIQKSASDSGCFLITPCHAHGAYFAQDERASLFQVQKLFHARPLLSLVNAT